MLHFAVRPPELTRSASAARLPMVISFPEERSSQPSPEPERADPSWMLEQEGFDPSRERELEPLFAIGNGFLGIRGALTFPIPGSQSDLMIAGVFDRKASDQPYSELEFRASDRDNAVDAEIVTFPSPLRLELGLGGRPFIPVPSELNAFTRTLRLDNGHLFEFYDIRCPDTGGALHIQCTRIAPLDQPGVILQEISLLSDHAREISLDTPLSEPDLALKHPHLTVVSSDLDESPAQARIEFATQASGIRVRIVSSAWLESAPFERAKNRLFLRPGVMTVIRRIIEVNVDRQSPGGQRDQGGPFRPARSEARRSADFHEMRHGNAKAWKDFWRCGDLRFRSHPELTQAQRIGLYHARIAAGTDERSSIGARGLTGRAYEGHVFWDTEIFIFPLLVHTQPRLARNCLDYRYQTLSAARERARSLGYQGACFAWESTRSGRDATPSSIYVKSAGLQVPVFTGRQQIHVTADIAYAAWKFWRLTRDRHWLETQGAELLVETARFWASRVENRQGRYHITRVVGPDEYHHDVDDNAFTNWMARFNLRAAAAACEELRDRGAGAWQALKSRLATNHRVLDAEVALWREIAEAIHLPRPDPSGVIEQFAGYFARSDGILHDKDTFRPPTERLLKWKEVNDSRIIKQADVLMIPFLFPKAFDEVTLRANYEYYARRTDHASSLSAPVHAAIAARLGLWRDFEKYWLQSLNLDLMNKMGNSALGIHLGCIGGAWQALVLHAMADEDDEGQITPRLAHPLPEPLRSAVARLRIRSRTWELDGEAHLREVLD